MLNSLTRQTIIEIFIGDIDLKDTQSNDVEISVKSKDSEIDDGNGFLDLISKVKEIEPEEARVLRLQGDRLTKDRLQELAVIAVKRAFSECPSIDILINALVSSEFYSGMRNAQIHCEHFCRLTLLYIKFIKFVD